MKTLLKALIVIAFIPGIIIGAIIAPFRYLFVIWIEFGWQNATEWSDLWIKKISDFMEKEKIGSVKEEKEVLGDDTLGH